MFINNTNNFTNITKNVPDLNVSELEMLVFFLILLFMIVLLILFCKNEYKKYEETKTRLNIYTGKIERVRY